MDLGYQAVRDGFGQLAGAGRRARIMYICPIAYASDVRFGPTLLAKELRGSNRLRSNANRIASTAKNPNSNE